MQDFLSIKLSSRSKIHPEFKRLIKEVRGQLVTLKQGLDQADAQRNNFETMKQGHFADLESTITRLIRETDRLASDFSEAEHLLHKDFLRDQLIPLFHQAPLHHRAFLKPLGYAGDYEMMRMLCAPDPFQGPSSYFKMINAAACRCVSGRAVAARIPYYLNKLTKIGAKTLEKKGTFRVLNLASGPALEIAEFLKEPLSDRATLHLLDQDPEAMEFARQTLEPLKRKLKRQTEINYHATKIQDLFLSGSFVERDFDLIYSGGLFDYLDDPTFSLALAALEDRLVPGGTLALGNLSPADYSKTVKWYLDDWPLIYRTEQDLLGLAGQLPKDRCVTIERETTGVNLFLVVQKTSNSA